MYSSNEKKVILKFMAYNEDIIFNEILKLTLICCNLSCFSAMERNLMFQRSLHIMRYLYNLTSYIWRIIKKSFTNITVKLTCLFTYFNEFV